MMSNASLEISRLFCSTESQVELIGVSSCCNSGSKEGHCHCKLFASSVIISNLCSFPACLKERASACSTVSPRIRFWRYGKDQPAQPVTWGPGLSWSCGHYRTSFYETAQSNCLCQLGRCWRGHSRQYGSGLRRRREGACRRESATCK